MGEYAKFAGERVKIGTCEDMYYLRFDQRHSVQPVSDSVDPVRDAAALRFRFPWPSEDDVAPGQFKDHDHKLRVDGVPAPNFDHYSVQFKTDGGYLCSLPCPESEEGKAFGEQYKVHRNGFRGAMFLVQQRLWEGALVAVCQCACDARFRLPTIGDALPVIDYFRQAAEEKREEAKRHGTTGDAQIAVELDLIADRITAGYMVTADA